MSKFMGGSAYSFARDIAEGFVTVSERSFRNLSPADMGQLAHEMERYLRELRGAQKTTEEHAVLRARNQKIQRLNGARTVLQAYRMKSRR